VETTMINKMLLGMGVLFATAGTAAAQSYEAEIDCGARDSEPGERVPFTIRLEEQAFESHAIELTVRLSPAGRPDRTVFETTIDLGPNEDRDVRRFLRLPITAPTGEYQLRLRADDGTLIVHDTCSFDVV
jgi:hypothetical protein